jgi:hypothetical protein
MADLSLIFSGLNGKEDALRDWIFSRLHEYFSAKTEISANPSDHQIELVLFERGFVLQKEASLAYAVAGNNPENTATLSHKCDLLLSVFNNKMQLCPVLNVEVKYRSCVSDAFKARAYDQIHMKQTYQHLRGLLVFIRPQAGGISTNRARLISYPFDLFWIAAERDLLKHEVWDALFETFENRMKAVAASPEIKTPAVRVSE